jgi:hypothetical protein
MSFRLSSSSLRLRRPSRQRSDSLRRSAASQALASSHQLFDMLFLCLSSTTSSRSPTSCSCSTALLLSPARISNLTLRRTRPSSQSRSKKVVQTRCRHDFRVGERALRPTPSVPLRPDSPLLSSPLLFLTTNNTTHNTCPTSSVTSLSLLASPPGGISRRRTVERSGASSFL